MSDNKKFLTHRDVQALAHHTTRNILDSDIKAGTIYIHPIPRGGVPVAYLIRGLRPDTFSITDDPAKADIFIDDIIDSGATAARYFQQYGKPTFALIDKQNGGSYSQIYADNWIVFPWEGSQDNHESVEDNVVRLLQYVGEDPNRGGLLETPHRVAKAWKEWTAGYNVDPASVMKVFEDGGDKYDQMVIVKDIPIYSKCEHHLADIFGTATIAYIPNGKIVGLSKLSRLADIYARRLQVQERLTQQIADALEQHLQPVGVGVLIRARHMCMESRGLCQQGHHTITTAFHGALKNDIAARQEFMQLA